MVSAGSAGCSGVASDFVGGASVCGSGRLIGGGGGVLTPACLCRLHLVTRRLMKHIRKESKNLRKIIELCADLCSRRDGKVSPQRCAGLWSRANGTRALPR